MKKIISKANFSLLIITLCAVLFCGLFAINEFISKQQSMVHAVSSGPILKNGMRTRWYDDIDYDIENLVITTTFNTTTATGEPVDVSEEQNGSLYAYKVDNGDGTYNCVIYADVEKIYAPADSSYLFGDTSGKTFSIKSIKFQNNCFDTSNVTNMEAMFLGLYNLTSLDLSCFNTAQVEDMGAMFQYCGQLQEINLSSFVTSNVLDMSNMFAGCHSLSNLILTNFNTSKVEEMTAMFSGCTNLNTLDISSFDLSSIQSQNDLQMFFGAPDELLVMIGGINLSDGQTFEQYLESLKSDVLDDNMRMYQELSIMRGSKVNTLHVPQNMGDLKVYLTLDNEALYENGNEALALGTEIYTELGANMYVVTSAEQGKIYKTLNSVTPTTGFVDEQLLPALAIGLVSIVVVCYVVSANKKRKFNI